MLIRLFDYEGEKEARQIVGDMPYVFDTVQKKGIVFFPNGREMDIEYFSCNITEKQIDIYMRG